MSVQTFPTSTFPSVQLPSHCNGLPVDVALIAQLGIGAGDKLIHGVTSRQRAHLEYIDALDEPSARIGGLDLAKGDATSLYTFSVGRQGHPFHRHAGHRVFTAISGSAGAQLRFSTASNEQIEHDPRAFLEALHHVVIPPDSLFSVRFGGGTWHQFLPLRDDSGSPALCALSCHTNELGGDLPDELRSRIESNAASIPALTELLPESVSELLRQTDSSAIPTVSLSFHAAPMSVQERVCMATRRWIGPWRGSLERLRAQCGFAATRPAQLKVIELDSPPAASLLRTQLAGQFRFEDSFSVKVPINVAVCNDAARFLAAVLEGFLRNPSTGVSHLMALRNVLVRPLRLRTSPLACPVSSLLSSSAPQRFAGRYPVLAEAVSKDNRCAQVILGADDRHLRFRSCIGVEVTDDGMATVTLGTRVQPINAFGRFYMAVIDRIHRRYISPTTLRMAVEFALQQCPVKTALVE